VRIKKAHFGHVSVFSYASGDGPQKPGLSVNLQSDRKIDGLDGEWMRLPEAKRLHAQLGKAIAYVEAARKRPARKGEG